MNINYNLPSSGEIARFLRNNNWNKIDFPNDKLLRFRFSERDDNNDEIDLFIPNGNDFCDGNRLITTAIEILSTIFNISFEKMVYSIKNQKADIFDQRIFGSLDLCSIPLEIMPKIMTQLRNLVYYSACAEEDASPYFERGRKIGKEYTEKCRFAHTFPGSFGLRIEMPLPPNPHDTLPLSDDISECDVPEPIERRIMKRIFNGLQLSVQGVNQGDVEIITKNFSTAFNANLCETMQNLTNLLPNYCLGYLMSWSTEYKIPASYVRKEELTIQSNQFTQFFESAAKQLRANDESKKSTICGKIVALHATPEGDDDDDADEDTYPSFSGQYIEIAWERSNGKKAKIKVNLSQEDYRKACDAHKAAQAICVTGIPEKEGKSFILTNPEDFHLKNLSAEERNELNS